MRFTGKIIKVGQYGKIKLPTKLLKEIGYKQHIGLIKFTLNGDKLTIETYKPVCHVTGDSSDDITEVVPGLYLSKKGMEIVFNELNKNHK